MAEGTYVVVLVGQTGVHVYGAFSADFVHTHKFDMWEWKRRWEAENPGVTVQLSLHRFEIKPTPGADGVERYYLPTEPMKRLAPVSP